jgi:hypothetical protein
MLVSLLWAAPWALAQVTVDLVLDQEQFLRDESLPVKVRITNRSGQTLRLGDQPNWLAFHLENREGLSITPREQILAQGEFSLEASRVATREVDLMPGYDLNPGRYFLSVTVRITDWNQEITSSRKIIEIIRGVNMWQEVVGVPADTGPPEVRKFILQQANYLQQPYLYVRLTDAEEHRVFRVLPIGRLLSFSRPEAQIDRQSNLHVLFQTGPRAFTYCVVSPTSRQRYDYSQTRPVLKGDGAGNITVSGGLRQLSRSDTPPPPPANPAHEVSPPAP